MNVDVITLKQTMKQLFVLTRDFLLEIASYTGLSYNEVNVFVWYVLIPFTWAILFDLIFGKHFAKTIVGGLGLIAIAVVKFTGSADLIFEQSAKCLLASNVGGSYVNASVVICLFVPIIVYLVMIPWAGYSTIRRRHRNRSVKVDA